MLTNPKLMLPCQIGRARDFRLTVFRFFNFDDLRRAMKSSPRQSQATGFGFLVTHGLALRGFTFTVRRRRASVSLEARVASFLLFLRLRAID
jgi:hypothetical protein